MKININTNRTPTVIHIQKNEFQVKAHLIPSTQYARGSNLATRCNHVAAVSNGYIAHDSIIKGIIKKLFINWNHWKSGINDAIIIHSAANRIETQIINRMATIIHPIHGKLIHPNNNMIMSNINH